MLSLLLKVEKNYQKFLWRIVEQGIIPPGAVLTDKKERFKATVSIDGTLKIKDLTGSIHQMEQKYKDSKL